MAYFGIIPIIEVFHSNFWLPYVYLLETKARERLRHLSIRIHPSMVNNSLATPISTVSKYFFSVDPKSCNKKIEKIPVGIFPIQSILFCASHLYNYMQVICTFSDTRSRLRFNFFQISVSYTRYPPQKSSQRRKLMDLIHSFDK